MNVVQWNKSLLSSNKWHSWFYTHKKAHMYKCFQHIKQSKRCKSMEIDAKLRSFIPLEFACISKDDLRCIDTNRNFKWQQLLCKQCNQCTQIMSFVWNWIRIFFFAFIVHQWWIITLPFGKQFSAKNIRPSRQVSLNSHANCIKLILIAQKTSCTKINKRYKMNCVWYEVSCVQHFRYKCIQMYLRLKFLPNIKQCSVEVPSVSIQNGINCARDRVHALQTKRARVLSCGHCFCTNYWRLLICAINVVFMIREWFTVTLFCTCLSLFDLPKEILNNVRIHKTSSWH